MIYDKSLRLPLWSVSQLEDSEDNVETESCLQPPKIDKLVTGDRSKKGEKTSSAGTPDTDGACSSHADFGRITNLMAEDSYNIMSFVWICHYVWAIPVKVSPMS